MDKVLDIIPGKSLAGISLNDNINNVIKNISGLYTIEITDGIVFLDNGLITIGYEDNNSIYSIMCNENFEGKYNDQLWAGMSVKDVLAHSRCQVALGGCVVVDGINGIGLPLPDGYDDFENITDFLPLNFIFKHLSVFRI
jgi:hypothetical protein